MNQFNFICTGHPNISAQHTKTLEFSYTSSIEKAADCVIGTNTKLIKIPNFSAHTPIKIEIQFPYQQTFTIIGKFNPLWNPNSGIILRKSNNCYSNTLAYNISAAANNIPSDLIPLLQQPDNKIYVSIVALISPIPNIDRIIIDNLNIGFLENILNSTIYQNIYYETNIAAKILKRIKLPNQVNLTKLNPKIFSTEKTLIISNEINFSDHLLQLYKQKNFTVNLLNNLTQLTHLQLYKSNSTLIHLKKVNEIDLSKTTNVVLNLTKNEILDFLQQNQTLLVKKVLGIIPISEPNFLINPIANGITVEVILADYCATDEFKLNIITDNEFISTKKDLSNTKQEITLKKLTTSLIETNSLSTKDISDIIAKIYQLPKNKCYQFVIENKKIN